MASALFQIQVDGGGYGTAGEQATASGGSVINCRLASVTGVTRVTWEFHGSHSSSAVDPIITLSGTPNGQIATFTLPAGAGQAWGITCKVNGGATTSQNAEQTSRSAVRVPFANGKLPVFVNETFEEDSTHSITPKFNDLLSGGGSDKGGAVQYSAGTTQTLTDSYATITTPTASVWDNDMSQSSNGVLQNDGDDGLFNVVATFDVSQSGSSPARVSSRFMVDSTAETRAFHWESTDRTPTSESGDWTVQMTSDVPITINTGETLKVQAQSVSGSGFAHPDVLNLSLYAKRIA